MYPMEYMCTNDEIEFTTTNITAESVSILIDQFTCRLPEFIHFAISKLFSYPLIITL